MENEQDSTTSKKRGRGPAKPYPTMTFNKVIVLACTIAEKGLGNQMRRVTLFQELGLKPGGSTGRQMIVGSNKYGLTSGHYNAESITLTEEGQQITQGNLEVDDESRVLAFKLAIEQIESFNALYELLKGRNLPAPAILHDELGNHGIADSDREKAAEVFLGNMKDLGLVKETEEGEHILSIDEVTAETAADNLDTTEESVSADQTDTKAMINQETDTPSQPNLPALHIDIQIHIDSSASPEQIDRVFASMARHLYGRDS